jgi:hypothetical protein
MPRNFRQLNDFADTTLGVAKNKHVLRYNNTLGRFQLIPFDTALDISASDRDISDSFVEQLEQEIEVGEVTEFDYDGGSF